MRLVCTVGEGSGLIDAPPGTSGENLIAKLPDGTLKIPDQVYWLYPVPNLVGAGWVLHLVFSDGTTLPAGTEVWCLD